MGESRSLGFVLLCDCPICSSFLYENDKNRLWSERWMREVTDKESSRLLSVETIYLFLSEINVWKALIAMPLCIFIIYSVTLINGLKHFKYIVLSRYKCFITYSKISQLCFPTFLCLYTENMCLKRFIYFYKWHGTNTLNELCCIQACWATSLIQKWAVGFSSRVAMSRTQPNLKSICQQPSLWLSCFTPTPSTAVARGVFRLFTQPIVVNTLCVLKSGTDVHLGPWMSNFTDLQRHKTVMH